MTPPLQGKGLQELIFGIFSVKPHPQASPDFSGVPGDEASICQIPYKTTVIPSFERSPITKWAEFKC